MVHSLRFNQDAAIIRSAFVAQPRLRRACVRRLRRAELDAACSHAPILRLGSPVIRACPGSCSLAIPVAVKAGTCALASLLVASNEAPARNRLLYLPVSHRIRAGLTLVSP